MPRGGVDGARLLAVTHETTRTGAPIVLLRFLEWLKAERNLHIETLTFKGGPLYDDFAALGPVHRAHAFGFDTLPEKVERKLAKRGFGPVTEPVRLRRLQREVRNLRGFDVIYCNSVTSSLALRILPELPRTVISHVHELDSAVAHWVDAEDRRSMIDQTSAFVVAADCVGRNLIDNHGVDPARVHCCYEFVDPPRADDGRIEEARHLLRLSAGELVVGAVGTADWRKGADLFIQVAARVLEAAPDIKVRFVWVGRALPHDLENHLEDLRTLGLSDAVTFVGEVPDPASYMSLFDVFCLTSREDPFPLVCLEAGALAIPVVTFENGGMVELAVADRGGDPLLTAVPYLDVEGMADAVTALLADRAGAQAMGARLRDWVVEHHLSSVGAAAVGAVVDRLLDAPDIAVDGAARR